MKNMSVDVMRHYLRQNPSNGGYILEGKFLVKYCPVVEEFFVSATNPTNDLAAAQEIQSIEELLNNFTAHGYKKATTTVEIGPDPRIFVATDGHGYDLFRAEVHRTNTGFMLRIRVFPEELRKSQEILVDTENKFIISSYHSPGFGRSYRTTSGGARTWYDDLYLPGGAREWDSRHASTPLSVSEESADSFEDRLTGALQNLVKKVEEDFTVE